MLWTSLKQFPKSNQVSPRINFSCPFYFLNVYFFFLTIFLWLHVKILMLDILSTSSTVLAQRARKEQSGQHTASENPFVFLINHKVNVPAPSL